MGGAAARARDWLHAGQKVACDRIESWAHGTVVRATAFEDYWDLNAVRVEDDFTGDVDQLITLADAALAGLAHRRVNVERIAVADRVRGTFEERGWHAGRLVLMRFEGAPPAPGAVAVEEVPYDAVMDLRRAWHLEDFPDVDPTGYLDQARSVAHLGDVRVLAVREGGEPAGYAQLQVLREGAEVAHVYVRPDRRGSGIGAALTSAAIRAGAGAGDLWIAADDEGRPKRLYARLGFVPVYRWMEFTRLPRAADA